MIVCACANTSTYKQAIFPNSKKWGKKGKAKELMFTFGSFSSRFDAKQWQDNKAITHQQSTTNNLERTSPIWLAHIHFDEPTTVGCEKKVKPIGRITQKREKERTWQTLLSPSLSPFTLFVYIELFALRSCNNNNNHYIMRKRTITSL